MRSTMCRIVEKKTKNYLLGSYTVTITVTILVRIIPFVSLNASKLKHQAKRSTMNRLVEQTKSYFLVMKQNWSEFFRFSIGMNWNSMRSTMCRIVEQTKSYFLRSDTKLV